MNPRRSISFVLFLLIGLLLIPGWFMLTTNVAADATITVNSTSDDTLTNLNGNGTCDLREAIVAANTDTAVGECTAGNAVDTIVFDSSLTSETDAYIVALTADSGQDDGEFGATAFFITSTVIIQGPNTENGIRLWGSFSSNERRLFHVMPGGDLTLENLTLVKGIARGGNGGGGNAGGGGGAGMGGAIFNQGNLSIIRTTFSENTAYGGHGRPNETVYGSGGGGGTGANGQNRQGDPGGNGGAPNAGQGGSAGGNATDGGSGGGGGGGVVVGVLVPTLPAEAATAALAAAAAAVVTPWQQAVAHKLPAGTAATVVSAAVAAAQARPKVLPAPGTLPARPAQPVSAAGLVNLPG